MLRIDRAFALPRKKAASTKTVLAEVEPPKKTAKLNSGLLQNSTSELAAFGKETEKAPSKPKKDVPNLGLPSVTHKKLLAWARKNYLDDKIIDIMQCELMDGATFEKMEAKDWIGKGLTPAPVRKLYTARKGLEDKLRLEARRKGYASLEYAERATKIGTSSLAMVRFWKLQEICQELDIPIGGLDELGLLRAIRNFLKEHDPDLADFEYNAEKELIHIEETEIKALAQNPMRKQDDQEIERLLEVANRQLGYDPKLVEELQEAERQETEKEKNTEIYIPDMFPFRNEMETKQQKQTPKKATKSVASPSGTFVQKVKKATSL